MGSKVLAAVNTFFEWVVWAAWINVLWLFFTLAGAVVFGWMPATLAAFATWRKLFMKEEKIAINRTFFQEFKQDFIRKNILGFICAAGFIILYVDFLFFQYLDGIFAMLFFMFVLCLAGLFLIIIIYLPPVYVHFKLNVANYVKQACMIGIVSPLASVSIVMFLVSVTVLYYFIPALIPVFGISPAALAIMKICLIRFEQLGLNMKN